MLLFIKNSICQIIEFHLKMTFHISVSYTHLDVYKRQVSNNFISFENLFEENAKVNYTIVDFGGRNSITNYYSNLVGDN